jgi:8-oxo-dGTP pyrophosphatase MutT (NUDIX family)
MSINLKQPNHLPRRLSTHPMRSWRTPVADQRRTATYRPFPAFRKPTPRPGKAEVYGAIIQSRATSRICLVQGKRSGKWSFPKGHLKDTEENVEEESPFECVSREVGEEIGIDHLPMPVRGLALKVGYYYMFEIPNEWPLSPRDTNEIEQAGWFTIDEMRNMNLNIDASFFRGASRPPCPPVTHGASRAPAPVTQGASHAPNITVTLATSVTPVTRQPSPPRGIRNTPS